MKNKLNIISVIAFLIFVSWAAFYDNGIAQVGVNDWGSKTYSNKNIEYIPDGEIQWVLESTNNEEKVNIEKIDGTRFGVNIFPTDKLSEYQKENYPIELFSLEYDEFGYVEKRIDYSPSTFGIDKSILDLTQSNRVEVEIPDSLSISTLDNLYMKIGPNSSTYSAVTNTITAVGGTESDPIDFDDIYSADLANGWGVVTKSGSCSSCFCYDAKIIIGASGTTTYFADTNKRVTFSNKSASNNQSLIYVYNNVNTHFTLGELYNEGLKITGDGVTLADDNTETTNILYGNPNPEINIYSCTLTKIETPSELCRINYPHGNIYNTILNRINITNPYNGSDLYNLCMIPIGIPAITNITGSTVNMEKISIHGCSSALLSIFTSNTYKNISVYDNTSYAFFASNISAPFHLVNCQFNNWSTNIIGSNGVNREYTLDLLVQDDNGAPQPGINVVINDYLGNNVFSGLTSSSGSITQQNLIYDYTDSLGSVLHTPHTMVISGTGILTKSYTLVMDEPKSLEKTTVDLTPIIESMEQFTGDYTGENTIEDIVSFWEEYIMELSIWLAVLVTIALTALADKVGSVILSALAAFFWTACGLMALMEPPLDNEAISLFIGVPSLIVSIALFVMIAMEQFGGRRKRNDEY